MEKNSAIFSQEVEDTMACSAFAEANEPCPIDNTAQAEKTPKAAKFSDEKNKSTLDVIEDTMACTAYAEAEEPCPIGSDEE